MALFIKLCGGRRLPLSSILELILILGRAAGKTQAAAALLIAIAYFETFKVSPGQTPVALLLAATVGQSRIAFNYVKGLIESSPLLLAEVVNITRQTIELRNGVEITIASADYKTVRGHSIIVAICDELAFWEITPDSANPDSEVLTALRPGLARFPNSMLICISSPYAQMGELYEFYRRSYGQDDVRVLVVHGATRDFNPTFPQAIVDEALERDPASAAAEYLAQFRTDRAGYIDAALLDSVSRREPREIPYSIMSSTGGHLSYFAGGDVSGGKVDATAFAVFRDHNGKIEQCAIRRWPSPHDPLQVAKEVAEFLATYKLTSARADQYGAAVVRGVYASAGVTLVDAPDSRSETYLKFLPLLTTGRVELSPDPVLRVELLTLERRTARGGRDSVDHRPGSHDDVANATALAAVAATSWTSPGANLVWGDDSSIQRMLCGIAGIPTAPGHGFTSIFDEAERRARDPLSDPCLWND